MLASLTPNARSVSVVRVRVIAELQTDQEKNDTRAGLRNGFKPALIAFVPLVASAVVWALAGRGPPARPPPPVLSAQTGRVAQFYCLSFCLTQIVKDDELGALVEGLEGQYVLPGPGGDPIRNPAVLPTGKNIHALDPAADRRPRPAARRHGEAEGMAPGAGAGAAGAVGEAGDPEDGCCGAPEVGAEWEAGADPALAACCERDLREQREAARIKGALRQVDRAMLQLDLKDRALGLGVRPPPPAEAEAEDGASSLDSDFGSGSGSESDDGGGGYLERARRARLGELQARARAEEARRRAAANGAEGPPAYATVDEGAVLGLAGRVRRLVCHLAVPGAEACAEADELLEALSREQAARGTRFVRVALPRRARLPSVLCPPGLPAVVCFRGGRVVGSADYALLGAHGEVHEELLRRFLRRSKALAPAGAADSDSDSDADEEEAGGDGTPCAQCGRTYPHKHVRAVYSTPTHPDGDDEGSGDDGG